jgi:membrane protein
MFGNLRKNIAEMAKAFYQRVNRLTGGSVGILGDAIRHFGAARAGEASASITFYAIFSLFPLLLALIAGGSFVLQIEQVQQRVLEAVDEFFPVAQRLIERNIQGVLEMRGAVGVVALISLAWSGTGALTILSHNINRAWPEAKPRNFVQARLMAMGMVSILAALLVISSVSNTIFNILARFSIPIGGGVTMEETPLWTTLLSSVPRSFVFLALMGLYRWMPNTQVKWSEAFWGALVATPVGELATNGFSWYLSSGIVHYELVYGSLGTVVALMLWIYIGILITLFGAHLSAAVARHKRAERKTAN